MGQSFPSVILPLNCHLKGASSAAGLLFSKFRIAAIDEFFFLFLFFRLNSIVLYEKMSSNEYNPIPLSTVTGPFFSLSYNAETQHILASCRPSEESSKIRHVYCELMGTNCQKIHTFNGGTMQTFLSRSCFIDVNNETIVAAFQENPNMNTVIFRFCKKRFFIYTKVSI